MDEARQRAFDRLASQVNRQLLDRQRRLRDRRRDDRVEPVQVERRAHPVADHAAHLLRAHVGGGEQQFADLDHRTRLPDVTLATLAQETLVPFAGVAEQHRHPGGHDPLELGDLDLDHRRAEIAQLADRVLDRFADVGLDGLVEEVRTFDADPHPGQVRIQLRRVVLDRLVERGHVAGPVPAGHRSEHQRRVTRRPRQRPDAVERRAHREDPAAAHPAEGGLQSDDAVDGCRDADRPAGVRPDRSVRRSDGDGDGGAGARAAGVARRVPRVAGRRRVLAVGELVRHGLADDHGTGLSQA